MLAVSQQGDQGDYERADTSKSYDGFVCNHEITPSRKRSNRPPYSGNSLNKLYHNTSKRTSVLNEIFFIYESVNAKVDTFFIYKNLLTWK